MDRLEEKLHRTWVQYLIDNDYREIATLIVDAELVLSEYESFDSILHTGLYVDMPLACYDKANSDDNIIETLTWSFKYVANGHLNTDSLKKISSTSKGEANRCRGRLAKDY